MILFAIFFLVVAALVFTYHYSRNGDPYVGGQFFSRLLWAVSFGIAYDALALGDIDPRLTALYIGLQFAAIHVPHAMGQAMGANAYPYNLAPTKGVPAGQPAPLYRWWPAFWVPKFTQSQWDALKPYQKTLVDLACMFSSGTVRGALVFLPPMALGWVPFLPAIVAAVFTAFWQPFAYFAGWRTPFALWNNAANSAEWGEFYVAIGWAIALLIVRLGA